MAQAHAEQRGEELAAKQDAFDAWVSRVAYLRPGDAVWVRTFERSGRIVRMRLHQQQAEVDMGSVVVQVPLTDLQPSDAPPLPTPDAGSPTASEPGRDDSEQADRAQQAPAQQDAKPIEPSPPPRKGAGSIPLEKLARLGPGDEVYVRRFHRTGRIIRMNADKQLAVVDMDKMEVQVGWDEIRLPKPPQRPARPDA
jgi:dsDNA-specific endonuclease/ATPase MutS2